MDQSQINSIVESIKQQIAVNAQKNNIETNALQFRISKKQGFNLVPIICKLFNGNEALGEVKINEMFNIDMVKMPLVNSYLINKLTELSDKNGISIATSSARIFTETADNYPLVDLYNEDVLIKKISIEELLN